MICALLAAAGMGRRMSLPFNKLLYRQNGMSILQQTCEAFLQQPEVDGVWVVCSQDDEEAFRALLGDRVSYVRGGETRGESVRNGLRALPKTCELVLIHDGARPFVDGAVISRCIADAKKFGSGVAAVPVTDTIKEAEDNTITATPVRSRLFAAQTPQAFQYREILQAYEQVKDFSNLTDDASAAEQAGIQVHLTMGDYRNRKITTREDLDMPLPKMGIGYDVHQLVSGRKLILGGVEIPYEKGLEGHSDADVLLHAVMDALLGAAGLGDIGRHFPDHDQQYEGISSMLLLQKVCALLAQKGVQPVNVSVVVVAQEPKLAPFISSMEKNLASVLGTDCVNIAATTTEHLGFEGRGEGISAQAVATIVSYESQIKK